MTDTYDRKYSQIKVPIQMLSEVCTTTGQKKKKYHFLFYSRWHVVLGVFCFNFDIFVFNELKFFIQYIFIISLPLPKPFQFLLSSIPIRLSALPLSFKRKTSKIKQIKKIQASDKNKQKKANKIHGVLFVLSNYS